jgi:hypothetical protein
MGLAVAPFLRSEDGSLGIEDFVDLQADLE